MIIKHKLLLYLFIILLSHSSLNAQIYKCTIGEKTSYQSKPCKYIAKKEKLNLKIHRLSPEQSCLSVCGNDIISCTSKVDPSSTLAETGFNICKLKKDWCESVCMGSKDIASKKDKYHMANNKYDYEKKINKINEEASEKERQWINEKQNRKNKFISDCLLDGKKEVKKEAGNSLVKELVLKKQLKKDCEKRANNIYKTSS